MTTCEHDALERTCPICSEWKPRALEAEAERDRYLRALVHIRSNAESVMIAHDALARIAGEFQETHAFINARWNYTEANSALTREPDQEGRHNEP